MALKANAATFFAEWLPMGNPRAKHVGEVMFVNAESSERMTDCARD